MSEVYIPAGHAVLSGHLTVPDNAVGLVLFAHGSGSSRHSPRNQFVARTLNDARLATLLFDLLTQSTKELLELTPRGMKYEIKKDEVELIQRIIVAKKAEFRPGSPL